MTKEYEITINKEIMIKVLSQYLCESFIINEENIISTEIEYRDKFRLIFTEPELTTEEETEVSYEIPWEDPPYE